MKRRTFLGAGIGGALTAGTWTSAFLWTTQVRQPVIEVIGRDRSQIVLIDSGNQRVLIQSGPYDELLADDLTTLMGTLRQRIDIVLSTESVLANGANDIRERWNVGTTISLPEIGLQSPPRANVALSEPIKLILSSDVEMRCWPHFASLSQLIHLDRGWRIEVQRGSQTVAIARSLDDLTTVPIGSCTLAIAPVGSIQHAERKSVAAVYAVNERAIIPTALDSRVTRIFASDAAHFQLNENSIVLPPWTTPEPRKS